MTEASLKSALVKALRLRYPNAVVLRHEDKITHGIPDISFTLNGRTSWWEGKFANPGFDTKGIQTLTMMRLAKQGRAYYIVWDKREDTTFFVLPNQIEAYRDLPLSKVLTFDADIVALELKAVHDYNRS